MMRSSLLAAALLLSSLAITAHAAESAPVKSCCSVPMTTQMTPAAFARTAANVNLTEIKLGTLAQTHSANPAVKKFAAYMVRSHTEMNAWLTTLAASQQIAVPTAYDKKSAATIAKLSALNGTSFDTTYIPAMVAGHTQVLAMVKSFAASTTDPAFKKFAQKITPIIANHLKDAKKVEARLQKEGVLTAAAQ